jgi:transposase
MARYHISEEEVKRIKEARTKNKEKKIDRRLEVLLLYAWGKPREEIMERTGYGKWYITTLVQKYRKEGLENYTMKHHKGNHRNLSFEEEAEILEPFKKQAAAGQVVEISEIKAAYEARLGRSTESSHGHIYQVLKRHGWRKVMPRSKHPKKADDEAIEASKKLKQASRGSWEILT